MSDRPLIKQYPSILNGDMSGNITGSATIIFRIPMVSFSFSWAGATPVGTVSVEVSNDYSEYPNGTVKNPGIWNVVPLEYNGNTVTTVPVSGNSGNGYIDIDSIGAYAIRPIYTFASGTGTIQSIIEGKVT